MSSRTCPDWPQLTEIAPDLQFKHYTVAEARLPGDALMTLSDISLDEVAICADLDKNVFYAEHTDPRVAEALRASHWYEVREWTTTGPGTDPLPEAGAGWRSSGSSEGSTSAAFTAHTCADFPTRLKPVGGLRPAPGRPREVRISPHLRHRHARFSPDRVKTGGWPAAGPERRLVRGAVLLSHGE